MTVTRNRFSSSSCMAPLMEPIAQHSWNKQQAGGNNRATGKQHAQLWPLSVKRQSVQIEANNRQIVTACVQQTNSQNYGHWVWKENVYNACNFTAKFWPSGLHTYAILKGLHHWGFWDGFYISLLHTFYHFKNVLGLTVLRFFHDHSVPFTWLWSFSVMMFSVSV